MGRPSKPSNLISLEGKSHRTKKELAMRRAAESKTLSGLSIKEAPEVKNDEIAHKTYLSIKKMFRAIDKDDALYSGVVNRYCILTSEMQRIEKDRRRIEELIEDIIEHKNDYEEYKEYAKQLADAYRNLNGIDRTLKATRQQLFSIEKENCMTISSALRSIPKKPETKTSALKEALGG